MRQLSTVNSIKLRQYLFIVLNINYHTYSILNKISGRVMKQQMLCWAVYHYSRVCTLHCSLLS